MWGYLLAKTEYCRLQQYQILAELFLWLSWAISFAWTTFHSFGQTLILNLLKSLRHVHNPAPSIPRHFCFKAFQLGFKLVNSVCTYLCRFSASFPRRYRHSAEYSGWSRCPDSSSWRDKHISHGFSGLIGGDNLVNVRLPQTVLVFVILIFTAGVINRTLLSALVAFEHQYRRRDAGAIEQVGW